MEGVYGLLILAGIVLILIGVYTLKHLDFMWNISWERRWFVKGGEPTEHYYTHQRLSAVTQIIIGALMIIMSISMIGTQIKGYVVKIDWKELKMPCTYSDIEALGYHIDSSEEIKVIHATTKNIKNYATYTVKNAEGKEFVVTFENRGETDKLATECELIAIKVEAETGPHLELPNGVKLGMDRDDVKDIMGKGSPRGLAAEEYRQKVNFDSYEINIVYTDEFIDRRVESIRVEDSMY